MATYAALAHTTWVDGYDMTGDSNQTSLKISREALDVTVFSNTARLRIAGLEDVQSTVAGFWQAGSGTVDPQVFANLGTNHVVTQTVSGTALDRAYMYMGRDFDYQMFGQVGAVTPFSLSMQAGGPGGSGATAIGAVAGRLLAAKQNVSATGAVGSGYQLGEVSASQYLYGTVHVFSAGTTITLIVQSDDNSGFTTPTTVGTVGPLTAAGGTWITRIAGAITDTYFRFNVSAITGTFSIAASLGIK